MATEIHGVPPLRQAVQGLGMVFAAAALAFLSVFAQALLEIMGYPPPGEVMLALWGLLDLLGFRGRWLCLRAKASLRAKQVLRASLVLSGLGMLVELGLAAFAGLVFFKAIQLDQPALDFIQEHFWLSQLAPLLHLLSTILFLFYIRGLAYAVERSDFGMDAMGVLVAAVVIYFLILPLIILLLWLSVYLRILRWAMLPLTMAGPAIAIGVVVLSLYPFILYCTLLTRMRDSLLYLVESEEREKKPKRHG